MVAVPPPVLSVVATVLLMTRSLNVFVTNVPAIDCAPVPLNVTVPVPGTKTVPVAAVHPPPTFRSVPAVNFPVVKVIVPVTVIVGGEMKSPSVCVSAPFNVSDVVLPPILRVSAELLTVILKNV